MPERDAAAVRERILRATYECVDRWGLAKTTVEDVAKEAGLSRATVYRYFPGGREELRSAVVSWEYARFFARLYEQVQHAESLEEVIERGLLFAHRAIEDHAVLQRILKNEPELLLPTLSAEGMGTTEQVAAFFVPYLERHELAQGVDIGEAASFLARMVLSFMAS